MTTRASSHSQLRLPFRLWILIPSLLALCQSLIAAPKGKAIPRPISPGPHSRAMDTALDRYVATPDSAYSWKTVSITDVPGGKAAAIDMTSQSWLTTNEVNRTVWRHWLVIVRPAVIESTTALLFIGGGSNRDEKPPTPNREMIQIATATRSVVAELKMVPNQPLIFGNDGRERVEDDLIAYTWDKYLRTGDERWPARLPMTKAAVRAMDTISAWTGTEEGGGRAMEKYVVSGGSKRGWTTWTTAIVDKRVVSICPIVIDVLNMSPSMVHHFQAYGFFSPAVGNYTEQGIMNWLGTPEMAALQQIEDPYFYRGRLALPKLIMNGCGDQFFLPDSSRFYFDQLPGTKYLRYVPNADHSLKGSDAYQTLGAWQWATLHGSPLPVFNWSRQDDGTIAVVVKSHPETVKLWQANNPGTRDFRMEVIGPAWWSTTVEADDKTYRARPQPGRGWTAYMLELTYDIGAPVPLKVTTPVWVTPDSLPHPAPTPSRPTGFIRQ